MRGSLTVSYNTLVVAGQFVATVVCGAFADVKDGWRWMLGLAGVPAAIQFIGEINLIFIYYILMCLKLVIDPTPSNLLLRGLGIIQCYQTTNLSI